MHRPHLHAEQQMQYKQLRCAQVVMSGISALIEPHLLLLKKDKIHVGNPSLDHLRGIENTLGLHHLKGKGTVRLVYQRVIRAPLKTM